MPYERASDSTDKKIMKAVLSYPKIFDLFQSLMGKKNWHAVYAARYIRAQKGDRVLDIGCGTAKWRHVLPDVNYYGFDPNPRYIRAAKAGCRDVPDCNFFCATVDETAVETLPEFDIVLALGVLHHLDDATCVRLVKFARAALKNGGRLISGDPCLAEGQSPVARRIIRFDRGRHVRDEKGYRKLVSGDFKIVKTEIRHDLIRVPYTHLIMECTAS